jgi:hypothetical protein
LVADDDGDMVQFSNAEELQTALGHVKDDNLLRIFIVVELETEGKKYKESIPTIIICLSS